MTIEKILNYVFHTPENTNREILKGMIKELQQSGGTTVGADLTPFLEGAIETITIPADCDELRIGAFYNCKVLKAIEVEGGNTAYKAMDGVLYTADGKTIVAYPAGKEAEVFEIPKGVNAIEELAFHGTEGTEIRLVMDADLLNAGGVYPMASDVVNAVVIPEDATFLAYETFDTLSKISTMYLNGQCEFETGTYIDSKGNTYDDGKILGSKIHIQKLIVGGAVTSIPDGFSHFNQIKHVEIGGSVKTIGNQAFCNGPDTALRTLVLENGIEEIGNEAFLGSSFTELTIPDSVVSIGYDAFANNYFLKKVTLGSGISQINGGMFHDCANLKTIDIPASVTAIESYSFANCPSTMVIRGVAGSYAETFATENGYTFEAIT